MALDFLPIVVGGERIWHVHGSLLRGRSCPCWNGRIESTECCRGVERSSVGSNVARRGWRLDDSATDNDCRERAAHYGGEPHSDSIWVTESGLQAQV